MIEEPKMPELDWLDRLAARIFGIRDTPRITVPIPAGLAPQTALLVRDFAAALGVKLRDAENKYGYRDGWLTENWETECRRHMREHMEKGDPRDVAIYAAFMWARGWSTAEPSRTKQCAGPATGKRNG